MKFMTLALFLLFHINYSHWLTDFNEAKKTAHENHRQILLTFSGSDWCGPCIRLHTEIFESAAFIGFADQRLVLVNADFPRLKRNQLSKEQQLQNDKLAEAYNPAGNFPFTVLLGADGNVLKQWNGFPKQGANAFIDEINQAMHDNQ